MDIFVTFWFWNSLGDRTACLLYTYPLGNFQWLKSADQSALPDADEDQAYDA